MAWGIRSFAPDLTCPPLPPGPTRVHGQKLSDTHREDVTELCGTLLNCYLTQLLDTGFMHADPHPGNLIVVKCAPPPLLNPPLLLGLSYTLKP